MRDVEEQNAQFNAGMFTLNEDGELVIDNDSLREAVACAAECDPDPQVYSKITVYIY